MRRLGAALDGTSHGFVRFGLALLLFFGSLSLGLATPLPADVAQEIGLGPPPPVPQLGPRYAVVTVDVSGSLGGICPAPVLRNLVRRMPQLRDVRLRFFPLRSGGERGAELWTAACEEKPDACFPLLLELCEHPEWLNPSVTTTLGLTGRSTTPGEPSEELWRTVARLGVDAGSLRDALRTHRQKRVLQAIWASARSNRLVPEVLVNERRVLGAQLDSRVMDEIDLQRLRAQEAIRNGTSLTRLSEQLRDTADDERRRFEPLLSRMSMELGIDLPSRPVRVHLEGLPCQGPEIAPTTLVLVLHHESYQVGTQIRAVLDAVGRHRDKVRVCVLHAPLLPTARRTSELIAQIAAVDPRLLFRVLDDLAELMSRRYFLRYEDVALLLRRRGELSKVEAASARGKVRVMADLAELQRLGLRPALQVILDGKVWSTWTTESLSLAILQSSRQGLLARLKKNVAPPP